MHIKQMKYKYMCLLLALVVALAGCAPKETVEVVVATVGDIALTRSEFRRIFSSYYSTYYASLLMSSEDGDSAMETLQDTVLQQLLQNAIIDQIAEQYGLILNEAEQERVNKSVEDSVSYIMDSFRASAEEAGEANVEAYVQAALQEELVQLGYQSESDYRDSLSAQYKRNILFEKLYDQFTNGISMTEEEAYQLFEAEVNNARRSYQNNPGEYEDMLYEYESGASDGMPPLYIPEYHLRVKHILVDTAELADTLLERLQSGEDFDALMEQYGTDTGMEAEPQRTNGYIASVYSSFSLEFLQAAYALENPGDISGVVQSEHGYHILKLVDQVEGGPISWEEYGSAFLDTKLTEKKTSAFNEQLNIWGKELGMVSYPGRIRDIKAP